MRETVSVCAHLGGRPRKVRPSRQWPRWNQNQNRALASRDARSVPPSRDVAPDDSQVGVLAVERGEPGLSSGRVDAGLDPFHEPQIVVGMLHQRRRRVVSGEQLLLRVLAHGLQQPIPEIRPFSIGDVHQRLVDQVR